MKEKITIIIATFVICCLGISTTSFCVAEQDSLTLVAIYNSTDGANWTNNTNWLSSAPVNEWYGVTVWSTLPAVESLNLKNNNLTGEIPSEIFDFLGLAELDLYGNKLSGTIPINTTDVMLYTLSLGDNQLSGPIPPEIGNIKLINSLNLERNLLTGTIPPEIGDLTTLDALNLSENNLDGAIPPEIGKLTKLKQLYLSSNNISGTMPSEIGDLSNLITLFLDHNNLTGIIPPSIGNLTKILMLNLNDNQFTDLPDLTTLGNLGFLSIQNNKFTFEDIEPNIGVPSTIFTYTPQDSVDEYQDITVDEGQILTVSVSVGGTNNQYQWSKDGTVISGATSRSYTIDPVSLADTGIYTCEITNTVATSLTLYSRPQNVTVLEAGGLQELSILEVASLGWMNGYSYTFNGTEYVPISPLESTDILPWSGFWVVVSQDMDLLIPKSSGNPYPPPTLHLENVEPNKFYMISAPLDPSSNRDINANFGDDLGNEEFEEKWRVSKWDYDVEEYNNYEGPGTLADIIPGRGFFLQHIHPDNKVLSITGDYIDPVEHYEMKLPSNGDPYTYHMAGNPYWYPIQWKDCMVRVPMTDGLPLAKPAVLTQEDIESWYLGLKVVSSDGEARDTYNRAGVIMTPEINPELLCAYDLLPPGDYIRLMVKDPVNSDRIPYSYDYRSPNMEEYTWQVELSTTYTDMDALFTLDNFSSIPEGFIITLQDNDSGEVFEINGDRSFDVSLSSGISKTFTLTAIMMPVGVEEEENIPSSFGITGVSPNPFNPITTIYYSLTKPGNVNIKIYNLNGQLVETIFDGYIDAGYHNTVWNAKGNASGLYFVSLVSDGRRDVRKIALVK